MNVANRIVFLDGQFPSIIFPVGPPEKGGTCAYLTEHCLLYCPARETNKHEKRALRFFKDNPISIIVEKILDDLSIYSLMHLYWWSWGDCLPELTDKITDIMFKLSDIGILQNGYTRNPSLWRNMNFPQYNENLRIGGHVDSTSELQINGAHKDKIICCPDVNVQKAEMYYNGTKIARCCGIWCDWITPSTLFKNETTETRSADCQECYFYKQGCFYQE